MEKFIKQGDKRDWTFGSCFLWRRIAVGVSWWYSTDPESKHFNFNIDLLFFQVYLEHWSYFDEEAKK